MGVRQLAATLWTRASVWIFDHKGEILWAGAFGILFAAMAWFMAPPKPDPYKIYVLADHHTDANTMELLLAKAKSSKITPFRRIDDVPIEIEIDQLPDDSMATIEKEANDISRRPDTLLVIGHLPSQLAETSLPIFFGLKPKIPFITTLTSDDNLLSRCSPAQACFDSDNTVPLLQLSPTNEAQGQSAVTYATIQGKRRFLIVYDNDTSNGAYTTNLVEAYKAAVVRFNQTESGAKDGVKNRALTVGEYKMNEPPSSNTLKAWESDCILYAGGMGEGLSLLKALSKAKLPTMVIFSDSTVQDGFSSGELRRFPGIFFTNQVDAADFNGHKNVYVEDAFAIAGQVIDDLQRSGGDFRLRTKTFFHIQSVRDVRADLNQTMKQNFLSHSWYMGSAPQTIYAFNGFRRFGGLFHVWQLKTSSNVSTKMDDVDHWHLPILIERPAK